MATLNEIVDIIAEPFGRPLDFAFREQIKLRVDHWRVRLLKDSLNRKPYEQRYFLQKFGERLIEVDEAECPVTTGCTVLRTERKIPKPLRLDGQFFNYVGTIDFKKAFSFSLPEQMEFNKHLKYIGNATKYTYINDYLYIFNKPTPEFKWIGVRSIFENPTELKEFDCGDNIPCYSDDDDYPISLDLLSQLIKAVTEEIRNPQMNKAEQVTTDGIQGKI